MFRHILRIGIYMACSLVLFVVARLAYIYRRKGASSNSKKKPPLKSLMVVFGSGGHTCEMLFLLEKFDFTKLDKVVFVRAVTDKGTLPKVTHFFKLYNVKIDEKKVEWITIKRSREVKQSYLTSVATTISSFFDTCGKLLRHASTDLCCKRPLPLHLHADMRAYMRNYMPMHAHTNSGTHTHAHAHAHAHTHRHTHTHTHTTAHFGASLHSGRCARSPRQKHLLPPSPIAEPPISYSKRGGASNAGTMAAALTGF